MTAAGISRKFESAERVHWYDRNLSETKSSRSVSVRVFQRSSDIDHNSVLVWLHGGSWVGGAVEQWHPIFEKLAARLDVPLLAVRYRLAPADPHPAALLDVHAVVKALHAERENLSIIVGGDSAGATIASLAALTLGGAVAGHVLMYPPTDPRCSSLDNTRVGFPTRGHMLDAWQAFIGTGGDRARDYPHSPLQISPTASTSPATLIVGSDDPLLHDVLALHDHLEEGGATSRLTVLPGAGHAVLMAHDPRNAATALDLVADETHHHIGKEIA